MNPSLPHISRIISNTMRSRKNQNAVYVCCLAVCLLLLPSYQAAVTRVIELYAITGHEYWAMCSIRLEKRDLSEIFQYDVFFKHEISPGKTSVCKVQNWQLCKEKVNVDNPKECGCFYKNTTHFPPTYSFYYYFPEIKTEYEGTEFSCGVGPHTYDLSNMKVITFSERPDSHTYNCSGGSQVFNWVFLPTTSRRMQFFVPKYIEWWKVDSNQKSRLGTYYFPHEAAESFFTPEGNLDSEVTKNRLDFPLLKIKRLTHDYDDTVIKIIMTFNRERFPSRDLTVLKKRSIYNVTRRDRRRNRRPLKKLRPAGESTTKMSTIRPGESDRSDSEIVIPLLSDIMEDWVAMTTTEPPSQHPKVTISAHQSMTGSLIITCAITNHLKFKGKPPFNLTIWHAGEPLVTKQGIETVRYSISHVSGKVTCGLAGPSLSCLPPGDDRLKQAVLKTQGVSVFGTTKEAVDFLIVLFALELSSCIMLLAWNLTLMLEHFRIIVQRKAFRVAQLREENEMNRFSY